YRRFPRPSSAPDAKASTMRSHTLTTPKGPASCVREMFQTHSYSMTRKSHYINNTQMLLMLASTIRFSHHYHTPPTSSHEPVTTTWQVGLSAETTPNTVEVCDTRTHYRICSSPP